MVTLRSEKSKLYGGMKTGIPEKSYFP
jgi:hypothetical protein